LTLVEVDENAKWLRMDRADPSGSRAVLFCNFSDAETALTLDSEDLRLALSTAAAPGDPWIVPGFSASLYLANP
jgi:hypothetical protein